MNKVIISGRVSTDLERRMTSTGKTVLSFNLAVPRIKKAEQEADFIRCVAFGDTAELILQYSRKGLRLGVIGRLSVTSYNDQEGRRIWKTDVIVESVEIIDFKEKETYSETYNEKYNETYNDDYQDGPSISSDELPF